MIALLVLLLVALIILVAMRGCSSTRQQPVEATVITTEVDSTNLIVAPETDTAKQIATSKKQNQSKKQSGQRLPDGRSRRHLDERVD